MSKKKVIISVAPVQAGTPVKAEILAEDVAKCMKAGASMCHLHCRKPDGSLTPDISYFSECFDQILKRTDIVVQASTGGVSDMNIEERCRPLAYNRTESASLNGGTTNLGEGVYINSFDDIRYCAKAVYEKGIIPEIEVFDIGMINNIMTTTEEVSYRNPIIFNLVFGHKGGMQPDMKSLAAFRSFIPAGALWGVTHFGRNNWNFLAAAVAMGASIVRIGFEDSCFLTENENAEYNWQLVEKLASLIRAMDFEPASPEEARTIMGIPVH
ncbi:MAG TPA: 3-keto-5-aminohexanoate cleavage protein [Candidatus Mediterraneibacter cottocaccae]|nr:3-keto-5-aminohexanoate cleavage protein [Candidatus Mediterraneibacter cottocaccae]